MSRHRCVFRWPQLFLLPKLAFSSRDSQVQENCRFFPDLNTFFIVLGKLGKENKSCGHRKTQWCPGTVCRASHSKVSGLPSALVRRKATQKDQHSSFSGFCLLFCHKKRPALSSIGQQYTLAQPWVLCLSRYSRWSSVGKPTLLRVREKSIPRDGKLGIGTATLEPNRQPHTPTANI